MRTKLYKVFTIILLILSLVAGLGFYSQWRGMRDERAELKAYHELLLSRRDKLLIDKNSKDEYYNRLMTDTAFSERVIREKLGYAYPDDIVFRFKDSEPVDEHEESSEKSEHSDIVQETPSLFDKFLAFFGFGKTNPEVESKENAKKTSAPEFRIDMTNASIAAVENKQKRDAQNAPSISTDSALGTPSAASLPENVALLSNSQNAGKLQSAKMKPVKVKLGSTNKNVAYASASSPRLVRFLSR